MSAFPRTHLRSPRIARRLGAATALSVLTLFATACTSIDPAAPTAQGDRITLSDQWIKAADSGMSAAFGNLKNTGDEPVTLIAATSPASARVEIHEVVPDSSGTKTMRPKEGGITIPAHGEVTLKPGAEHLMFMDLRQPLRTGAETTLTLTFADGSTTEVTAQIRDFAGGNENYAPSDGHAAPNTGTAPAAADAAPAAGGDLPAADNAARGAGGATLAAADVASVSRDAVPAAGGAAPGAGMAAPAAVDPASRGGDAGLGAEYSTHGV